MKINDIYHDNALSFLSKVKDGTINLILTDPPYIISKKTGFQSFTEKSISRFAVTMDFGNWDKMDIETHNILMKSVIKEYFRVLKNHGACIIFYDLWKIETLKKFLESVGFQQIRFLEIIKTNPVPINSKINYLTNAREIALLGVKKGKPTFNSQYDNGIYYTPIHRDGGKGLHPCQKPLKIMNELILKHSNESDIILDTFAGSGTILISAKENNRNFLGCEIDKNYFDIAKMRFEG
jgi:DNA modification methylase